MNPPESTPPPDPERWLRSRLRDTTPEFEARFNDLRRRLAQETPRRARWAAGQAGRRRPAFWRWLPAMGAAAVALVAGTWWYQGRGSAVIPPEQAAVFDELLALDDALRGLGPLSDPEMLEALMYLPENSEG